MVATIEPAGHQVLTIAAQPSDHAEGLRHIAGLHQIGPCYTRDEAVRPSRCPV